jgi:hypothetical protein
MSQTPPPIDPPAGWLVFHGRAAAAGHVQYEPSIPLGDVQMKKWLFTWSGVGQWITPQFIPLHEHWVAVPPKRKASLKR